MAERTSTHPNWVAAGIVLVAAGAIIEIPVFVHVGFAGARVRDDVAIQLVLALGYVVLAGGYRSWIAVAQRLGDRSVAMARPLTSFAIANVLFTVAFLVDSWMNLGDQIGHPFDGWTPVVWTIGRVVTCLGYAVASLALWISARALHRVPTAVDDTVASEVTA